MRALRYGGAVLALCLCCVGLWKIFPETVREPVIEKKPKTLEKHGDTRTDEFFWLRERENPAVLDYLKRENAYVDEVMKDTEPLQKTLFEEMRGRMVEDESSVPYFRKGYWYYSRFDAGSEYPTYFRRKSTMEAKEEVVLDVPTLAKGEAFFQVGGLAVTPDSQRLAYAVDTQGRRIYTIYFSDLQSGKVEAETIEGATGNIVWAEDGKTLFYAKQDPTTLRSDTIYRHVVGSGKSERVYHEEDETFSVSVGKTRSSQYLVIHSGATLTDEVRLLKADNPTGQFEVFQPRVRGLEYSVDDGGDRFYVLTNWKAKNFRVMETSPGATGRDQWKETVPHRDQTLVEDVEVFKDFLVLQELTGGLPQIQVLFRDSKKSQYIEFDDPTYTAEVSINPEFETDKIRFSYESLTTPDSVYDYDVKTGKRELKKEKKVLGGFDKANYASERRWAEAKDGTRVPVSLVYRKDRVSVPGSNPTLLYGYGSYGLSMLPYFSSHRLSLLDRGFVFAIAHIRGGSEMGRQWYEDGKLLKKKNTFTDFIACAEMLISEKFTTPKHLYAMGGSAGGLLMGAVINLRTDLFHGVQAAVPFVDVVTTMLDDTIPLTTGEYDEWGNPNEAEYYHYMKSYSPYDNVREVSYPNLLVTTGLHDSQVQYWEPAKWVARLRDRRQGENLLLLKTDMDVGHGGASGRYESLKLIALEYAFFLKLEGQTS